jgi:phospholipid-translocating ATPase
MAHALRKFFPDNGIISEDFPRSSSRNDGRRDIPLERIDTGISSIFGVDNGDHPGGFVLVIDGAALLQVGSHACMIVVPVLMITGL